MSYLVLARKYRPRTFQEVAGQTASTRTLQGAISEERVGHAYLFTGPRGTGKTTSARLFAKALNCEQGPALEPCGTCDRCQALDAGSEVDVIEIDAASNTGVDHVRELRDQAAFAPMRARYKIYVVDEVHMLSKAAFNALLKTLEEPPSHVKFLFATTELHKVPDTIRSRCQILRLSPLSESEIDGKLREVFAAENVTAEEGVTAELARRARGGMRDALSLADQLLAAAGDAPTLADCERLASEGSTSSMGILVEAMLANDRGALLGALPASEGSEAEFLGGLMDYLRGAMLAALVGRGAPVLPPGLDASEVESLAEKGKAMGARRLELWLAELLHARERMRLLPSHARLILEVTLLDLCRPEASIGLDELAQRLAHLEQRLGEGDFTPAAAPSGAPAGTRAAAPAPSAAPAARREAAPAAELTPQPPPQTPTQSPTQSPPQSSSQAPPSRPTEEPQSSEGNTPTRPRVRTNSVADAWTGFLAELEASSAGLHEVVSRRGNLAEFQGGRATIKLAGMQDTEREMIASKRSVKACEVAFQKAIGREVRVVFEDVAATRPGAEDPFTTEVKTLFQGRIEDGR